MGDRVLVQLHKTAGEVSPVLYGHWSGHDGKIWLEQLKDRMDGRLGDLAYSFARLVQLAVTDASTTGFGVWNQTTLLTSRDSHGDAGIYLLNVDTNEITHIEEDL